RAPVAPAASRGNERNHTSIVTTGWPETIRHSLRNGGTAAPCSPRCIGLVSHRRSQIIFANLTPASRGASARFPKFVLRCSDLLQNFGKQRALAKYRFECRFRFEVPVRTRDKHFRNFKSAALVPHGLTVRAGAFVLRRRVHRIPPHVW